MMDLFLIGLFVLIFSVSLLLLLVFSSENKFLSSLFNYFVGVIYGGFCFVGLELGFQILGYENSEIKWAKVSILILVILLVFLRFRNLGDGD